MKNEPIYFNAAKENQETECLIIMPIFNRRRFLKDAFMSLKSQIFSHWNLIIVDDGSSDDSLSEITELAKTITQPVKYVYQQNAGPGAARDKGLSYLKNELYIAFFDSDDVWLSNYLSTMINQLKQYPKVNWLFCACKRVELKTGNVLLESTHYDEITGDKSSFFSLKSEKYQDITVFTDNRELAKYQIKNPINAGFQNSVIRSKVVQNARIPHDRIGEDRIFLLDIIIKKNTVGFIEKALVIYNVHSSNISDTNKEKTNSYKSIEIQTTLANAYKKFGKTINDQEIKTLINAQINDIMFWHIAYNGYVSLGMNKEASIIMKDIAFSFPLKFRFIKTYFMTLLKQYINVLDKKMIR